MSVDTTVNKQYFKKDRQKKHFDSSKAGDHMTTKTVRRIGKAYEVNRKILLKHSHR